jgi:hypothetical protein
LDNRVTLFSRARTLARRLGTGVLGALLLLGSFPPGDLGAQAQPATLDDAFKAKVQPLLGKYCLKCHGAPGQKAKAELDLNRYSGEKSVQDNRKIWKEILTKLYTREMPPEDAKPQPSADERATMTDWVETVLNKLDATGPRSPGRVVARRLNRFEYSNTIRDLLGVEFNAAADFPSDDIGYGFDNIGDVLSLPPLLMEKYVAASKKIVGEAITGKDKDRLIFIARPDEKKPKRDAAKEILAKFLPRAFRRTVLPDELERFVKLFDVSDKQEATFDAAMKLPLRAALISPHFLFRIELDMGGGLDGVYPISDFEFASRLSYFLWSSMPDDELLEQAKRGGLRAPKTLEAQVTRMLKDPRSHALAEHFTVQWLQIRRLETAKFSLPGFDDDLRRSMVQEAVLFFEALLKEDRSLLEMIESNFTYVNDRLARHYGLSATVGRDFQKVTLTDPRRGGVLTMAAVLAATSDPNRTSPVKRGKWILESILGTPPPPPLPDAANLKDDASVSGLNMRQRMEQHRANPVCASCHAKMDPIGFGFENYDAIGAWRDRDGTAMLDTSATLPDGKSFKGPVELKAILKAKKADFIRCLTEKMLTYAMGRGVEYFDGRSVSEIGDQVARGEYKFSTLVMGIAKSYPFQNRQRDNRVKR